MVSSTGRRAVTAFPNDEESLALQASLLDGEPAVQAWRKLTAVTSPENAGIAWIAPLLMANLKRLAPDDPWVRNNPHFLTLAKLKGLAMIKSAEAILDCLARESVPTMALKGLALGETVYDSPGLRTVSDLDILVPGRDVFRAMDALKRHGFRSGVGEPGTPEELRANHAHVFYPQKRHELSLDLHWHVLASARGDEDDLPFWSAAQPLTIGNHKTLALSPEDQLLHILVHGVRWTRMPHVRWVADATLLLRKAGRAIDVERFLEAAQRTDAVVPVQEGLAFVAALIGEGRELLPRVTALKRSRFAERAFWARATSYEDRSVIDRIALRIETAVWARRAKKGRVPSRGPRN